VGQAYGLLLTNPFYRDAYLNFSQNLKLGTVLALDPSSGASCGKKAKRLIVLEDISTPIDQMENLKDCR